jgi:hypothetical protein
MVAKLVYKLAVFKHVLILVVEKIAILGPIRGLYKAFFFSRAINGGVSEMRGGRIGI